jgi:hypothetical protein
VNSKQNESSFFNTFLNYLITLIILAVVAFLTSTMNNRNGIIFLLVSSGIIAFQIYANRKSHYIDGFYRGIRKAKTSLLASKTYLENPELFDVFTTESGKITSFELEGVTQTENEIEIKIKHQKAFKYVFIKCKNADKAGQYVQDIRSVMSKNADKRIVGHMPNRGQITFKCGATGTTITFACFGDSDRVLISETKKDD